MQDFDEDHFYILFGSYVQALSTSPLITIQVLKDAQCRSKSDSLAIGTMDAMHFLNSQKSYSLINGHLNLAIELGMIHICQPLIEEYLNDIFNVLDNVHPVTRLASSVITGTLILPWNIARLRLLIQDNHGPYYTPLDLLMDIPKQESSSFSILYFNRVFFPNALYYLFHSGLSLLSQFILEEYCGISCDFQPFIFKLCRFGCIFVETIILTPIDLVKTRFSLQPLSFQTLTLPMTEHTVVPLSGQHYSSIWSCIRGVMLTEQVIPKPKLLDRELFSHTTSIPKNIWSEWQSLYRSFWERFYIRLIDFVFDELRDYNEYNLYNV
jgi:hypothetical protein